MRNPENVLNSLQEHSAQSGYVYDRLYRNLFNREFFLQAYQNIYASQGNMTAGTDGKTIDAMSLERVDRLIAALKDESYQPKPSRRTYIPKKNGKLRPLGIPSIDDKLVQEVVRMLLESIYENSFEDTSHGFRPNKSCHTALRMIQNRFTRCKWFVEGDIKGFFDNIDHNVMIGILRKRIKDERFLRLIRKFLNAGYMEDNQVHQSYSGTPQGGIISPILANIYLDQFDKYMAEFKKRFDRGNKRAVNVEYRKLSDKRIRLKRKLAKAKTEEEKQSLLESIWELDKVHKSIPCKDPMDENFRRLQYVRYADDFLIGIIGAKEDAQAVKQEIGTYIAGQLKLELSDEKTLVTKATDRAKFLGFEIRVTPQSNHTKKTKSGSTARNYSGHVMLEVPTSAIQKKLLELGAMRIDVRNGTEIWQPTHRGKLVGRTDLSILDQYNGEIRGFCNYYAIDYQADNHRTDNADKQIQRVNARQGVFKGCGKSLCDIQYLCRNIRAGGKPHRLSDFIKEIDKEHIGDIRKYQLFVVDLLHISRPLSIFFTLSRAALSCFALSFAAARALRIEGFFSRFSFFAENS